MGLTGIGKNIGGLSYEDHVLLYEAMPMQDL